MVAELTIKCLLPGERWNTSDQLDESLESFAVNAFDWSCVHMEMPMIEQRLRAITLLVLNASNVAG